MSSVIFTRLPVSTETLMRLKPKIMHLKEHGLTPECIDSPLTEEQIMMRQIIRAFSSSDYLTINGHVIKMTADPSQLPPNTPAPLTQEERDIIRADMEADFKERMKLLSTLYNKLKVHLNDEKYDTILNLSQTGSGAYARAAMAYEKNSITD